MDRVQSWWNRHSFVGTPSFVLAKKIKALKEDIVQWNCQEFGNVERQKKQLLEELKKLDAKEGEFGLTDGEKRHRAELRSQVEHLLSLKKFSGDKNLGCYVSRKGIITPSSSIKWLTLIEGIII